MTRAVTALVVLAAAHVAPAEYLQRIAEGPDWVVFDYRRDIVKGSALDFSSVAQTDAPAGKYGWLKPVGEHFEFERLPGKVQRFYGVNLCMSLNYPTHEEAGTMITRFRRIGYNSIRIHHHDRGSVERSPDGLTLNPEKMDRLDYLIAAAIKAGMYVTTDLYVSRPVKWRQIGIDRDGYVNSQGYKALTLVHEPAYRDWQTHARNFLFHLNPYTGRRYIDEPALSMLVTVNENWLCVGWKHVKDLPVFEERFRRWKAEKTGRYGADFLKGSLMDSFAESNPWVNNAAASLFFAELEAEAHLKREKWLGSVGCRALLSAGNHGPQNAPNQRVRSVRYDYTDDHSYESHPKYLNKKNRYALPKSCDNRDYLDPGRFNDLSMNVKAFSRAAGKPLTVSEWNCCGPSEYRQIGGIYGGALFAMQDWGGVWRFAYSHDIRHLHDVPRTPGAFDVSADPVMVAQERQIAALFLRRDADALASKVNFILDDAAMFPAAVERKGKRPRRDHMAANPAFKENLMFAARVSCSLKPVPDAENFLLSEYARDFRPVPFSGGGNPGGTVVKTDFTNRTFTVGTARCCGVYGPAGHVLSAGALKAGIRGARAAVSAIALDGRPLTRSGRILVSHLTDAKGRGAVFEETPEGLIQREAGDGTIVIRAGKADVSVGVPDGAWKVYALSSSGARRFEVPSGRRNGRLEFIADVRGRDGRAVMEYELSDEDGKHAGTDKGMK